MEFVIDTSELEDLAQNLSTIPVVDFLKEMMESAEHIVNFHYAQQVDAGNVGYTTQVITGKDSATLIVSGEDVGFLEFGAGIGVKPNDFAEEVTFPVEKGSYSNTRGGMYARTGYIFWVWNRQSFDGKYGLVVEATSGMQEALNHLRKILMYYIRKRIISWLSNGK